MPLRRSCADHPRSASDGYGCLDGWMTLVVFQLEVFIPEVRKLGDSRIQLHFGQWKRFPGELQSGLVQMVSVQMHVSEGMDEFMCDHAGDLRDHHGEQGIGGDIEGHTQKYVCTALVQLAAELTPGFAFRQIGGRRIKLEQAVAGAEGHFWKISYVPGIDDQPPGIGIAFELGDHFGDLVRRMAVRGLPTAPLLAIYRTQVARFVRPFVPYLHSMLLQVSDIGIPLQKPEQFVDNGFQVDLLGGHQRESFR